MLSYGLELVGKRFAKLNVAAQNFFTATIRFVLRDSQQMVEAFSWISVQNPMNR